MATDARKRGLKCKGRKKKAKKERTKTREQVIKVRRKSENWIEMMDGKGKGG